MKQNHHFMVPDADFRLLQGEDKLTLYQASKFTMSLHLYISEPDHPDPAADAASKCMLFSCQ